MSHCVFASECKPMQLLLNVGGPDRVSRVQMAETVAYVRGHDKSLIKSVSASSVRIPLKSLFFFFILVGIELINMPLSLFLFFIFTIKLDHISE